MTTQMAILIGLMAANVLLIAHRYTLGAILSAVRRLEKASARVRHPSLNPRCDAVVREGIRPGGFPATAKCVLPLGHNTYHAVTVHDMENIGYTLPPF